MNPSASHRSLSCCESPRQYRIEDSIDMTEFINLADSSSDRHQVDEILASAKSYREKERKKLS